jgi:diguanylate cyclase (GGDEF)-like protein/PAS domain S-box-containing protein
MAKVVVVDDRVTNRNILTRLALSVEEGLQVSAYASAMDALAALAQSPPPDLVITDFNMPEMDGAAFIRSLRQREGFSDVPIVVVTVYEDRDFCYQALEAGATDFLLSPVDHLEFRARARNLLMLRRQQRLLAEKAQRLEAVLRHREGRDEPAFLTRSVERLLESLPAGVSLVDPQGRLAYVNRRHARMFGLDPGAVAGKRLGECHDDDYATRHSVLNEKVLQTATELGGPRSETISGEEGSAHLLTLKSPLLDAAGQVRNVLTLSVDVTELKRAEMSERGNVAQDPLTGLASFELFCDRVNQELGRARRQNEIVGLLHLDLDRFKGINEAFGSEFGDLVLRAVAQRLQGRLRESDSLARIKSDEFVVLQSGLRRPDEAAELCLRLGQAFGEPFVIEQQEIHLSASIGATLFPADGKTLDTLLKNADLAMYKAKASGRDSYRFFAAEMNLAARRAITLERELRQALAGEQFVVHYQPQLELLTQRIIGVEALVRWNHPQRGLVRPGEFIGLAEDIGLIAPLTAWVLHTGCRQLRLWQDRGLGSMQLSVNLSPVQFRERGVELLIERVLCDSGVAPASLDIELTENAVIENSQTASASLRHLHQLGVTLSIDDFGTGYSSLSYLKRLPVQRLKIDQSFVQNLETSGNDEVIVRAIINLGHSLGLRVIAEGVETEAQLHRLERFGCDEVQGDLISPPLPAAEIERRLTAGELRVATAA